MTTIDWNWFFAAFAQCAAGLIAIIGAFIISKLLGEVEKEEAHNNNIDQLIIQLNDLLKRIESRHFDWHDKRYIEYSSDISDAIKNGDFDNLDDEKKLKKLFQIEPRLFGSRSCLIQLNEEIERLKPKTTHLGNRLHLIENPILGKIIPNGLWNQLAEEREIINQLNIESDTLIERFAKAKNDLFITRNNLKPIKITIYILAIGLLITVIYPLHFMPIELNESPKLGFSFELLCNHLLSIKGFLLLMLALVIEGIFGYFLWLTNNIEKKYDIVTTKLKEKYFSKSEYCIYFN